MTTKIPLSVFIITRNEADRIKEAILPLIDIVDEMIVVDSGSTDNTVEICQNLGCKTQFNEWKGYGKQKIFAQNLCQNNWVLNIDADEILSNEAVNEIKEIFDSLKYQEFSAYRLKIINQFPLEKKPHKFAYFYNQIRLYNKKDASFSASTVHDSVIIKKLNSNIGQIKSLVAHKSFRSLEHWFNKINYYSSMQADDAVKKGKKNPSILKISLISSLAFFKAYIIRRYFIYGINGIIYSYMFSFSRLAKVMKTREAYLNKQNLSKYD